MTRDHSPTPFADLVGQFTRGEISRRAFLAQGAALGVGLGMLGTVVRHVQTAGAQQATPAGSPPAGGSEGVGPNPPNVGGEGKTRGQDGELKALIWQAPTTLSAHQATGDKDTAASSLVTEPLLDYNPDLTIYPRLVTQVPTTANGDLAPDFTSVTFHLISGVLWSDGTPFTAKDVVFTHQWVIDPATNAPDSDPWTKISAIDAVDDTTVKVTFAAPNLTWYEGFTGGGGHIMPEHYVSAGGDVANKPLGTGPFIVKSFSPNDQTIYEANPNFRVPSQPYFATVNLKGGGEAATTAQAVIQKGDWDYSWNVAVEPDVLNSYLSDDSPGLTRTRTGSNVERININFSDPRKPGPSGELSWYKNPHPILSDPAVRKAMAMGIDRDLIVNKFYSPPADRTTANFLTGIPSVESPNTKWVFDTDAANKVLDDAGWKRDGDSRSKDGVKLELDYVTTISAQRQKTQLVVKQNWSKIGITVNLKQVDSGIFFDSAAGNTQNSRHMYTDLNMFTSSAGSPIPIDYMKRYYAGKDASGIAQKANAWSAPNFCRYQNPDYDAIMDRLDAGQVSDASEAYGLLIQLNDILINDDAVIPVANGGSRYAISTSLIHGDRETGEDNVNAGGGSDAFKNIAAWNRATPVNR